MPSKVASPTVTPATSLAIITVALRKTSLLRDPDARLSPLIAWPRVLPPAAARRVAGPGLYDRLIDARWRLTSSRGSASIIGTCRSADDRVAGPTRLCGVVRRLCDAGGAALWRSGQAVRHVQRAHVVHAARLWLGLACAGHDGSRSPVARDPSRQPRAWGGRRRAALSRAGRLYRRNL